ncbi:BcDNA.LD19727 [Strongyloides ratti]|uniref:Tetraspanin n=1 Tax=Strongyloides ratti TaxID=34506 RepID=A0A090N0W6_STRRB|nr:BcDNA.LD19727 [Strongyloides ratti]CEF71403.1 BcDNA.LD19727 [Strongyloides ratti]
MPSTCCVNFIRSATCLLNLFFWLAGVGTLCIGLLMLLDPIVNDLWTINNGAYTITTSAYMLTIVGSIMTILGFCGLCGVWKKSEWMLICFCIILIVVFCLEFACALIAYNYKEKLEKYVGDSMTKAMNTKYGVDDEYTSVIDRLQRDFECCGVNSYRDWLKTSWSIDKEGLDEGIELGIGGNTYGRVPTSCCNINGLNEYDTNCGVSFNNLELWTYERFLNIDGCVNAIKLKAKQHVSLAVALSVFISAVQLFGIFLTMTYCCCINKGALKNESRR